MAYRLAIDLGTTFTAAATTDGGVPTVLGLGNRALQVPSVVYLTENDQFLVGESAERRGASDPARLIREFKRRLGDQVPILVDGRPYEAERLITELVRWVVGRAEEQLGEAAGPVVLTHPASWGPYKSSRLLEAARQAGLSDVSLCTEPEAAGARYATNTRVDVGEQIAIYDLGGGTFDACVLRRTDDGFVVLGTPEGLDLLGGVDFDDAIFQFVREIIDRRAPDLEWSDREVTLRLARLRRYCVEAKEGLSSDTDAVIQVDLPGLATTVRLTRAEFEGMIQPAIQETLTALHRALRSAGVQPADLRAVVLVGGSSRIPAVAEAVTREFGVATGLDIHPKHDIALGALVIGSSPPPVLPTAQQQGSARASAAVEATGAPRISGDRVGAPSGAPGGGRTSRPRRRILVGSIAGAALAALAATVLLAAPWRDPSTVTAGDDPTTSATAFEPLGSPSPRSDPSLPRSTALPDTRLAVAVNVNGNVDVYLGDVSEPAPTRRLTTSVGIDTAPVMSPDRRSIVYNQQFTDPATNRPRRVLRVVAADGRGDRPLFVDPPAECDEIMLRPAWNPVDQTLLAVPCQSSDGRGGLYLARTSGEIVEQLTIGAPPGASWAAADATFSPDGKRLAFWAGPSGLDGGSIYVVDITSSETPRRLTTSLLPGGDSDPAWSPDGATIAYRRTVSAAGSDNQDIYLIAPDGAGGPRPLVETPADDLEPSWSSASDWLSYVSRQDAADPSAESRTRTWLIKVDRTGQRLMWTSGDLGAESGSSWTRR